METLKDNLAKVIIATFLLGLMGWVIYLLGISVFLLISTIVFSFVWSIDRLANQ